MPTGRKCTGLARAARRPTPAQSHLVGQSPCRTGATCSGLQPFFVGQAPPTSRKDWLVTAWVSEYAHSLWADERALMCVWVGSGNQRQNDAKGRLGARHKVDLAAVGLNGATRNG